MTEVNDKGRDAMDRQESIPALRRATPLPIALYSSNGLLFELYDGGQPYRPYRIVWERVKTVEEQIAATTSSADRSRDLIPNSQE
jgi:hypothetical protein